MKQNVLKSIYLLTLLFSIVVASCVDDFPYRTSNIPEGEGTLSATVTFTPNKASNLGATRTDGDALNEISSLCVLVYNKDKELVKKYTQNEDANQSELYKYSTTNTSIDDLKENNEYKGQTDEKETAGATFQLVDLPYGEYYIFAVANMGDLKEYEKEIETVEGLRNITLRWDPDFKPGTNKQMFGYFTPSSDMDSDGFEYDTPITFTGKVSDSKIHAWLKRAASKVTVAFDPSGLNQDVVIYIRNVTVRDIPKTCLLGAVNTPNPKNPEDEDGFYNHLASYNKPDFEKNPTSAVANSRLWYDDKGVITEIDKTTGDLKTDGLRLDNSIRSAVPAHAHDVNAPSLFFYENNQNPYLEEKYENYKSDSRFNKTPQTDGEDKVGKPIHDPNNDSDFKDRVPNGTYVEVEAYYISSNPANPGEGTIKYRFMLGKDTSFDYNAERNFHYKLTLGFKGWANDPDWHIDYVITNPGIEVPEEFRVSYLYQQKSELPIKIVGEIDNLIVTIIENNWAPYDPTGTKEPIELGGMSYDVPAGEITGTGSDPTYNFKWNREAFWNDAYVNPQSTSENDEDYPANLPTGQQRPQFGFLALHLPSRNTTSISLPHGQQANTALINYWATHQEGFRSFSKDNGDFSVTLPDKPHYSSSGDAGLSYDNTVSRDDNAYSVNAIKNDIGEDIKDQVILMLPLWTRTKSLISEAGFSGNNPYEAFERKAVVRIKGKFVDGSEITKEVKVFQVKRITNPKGVWRAHDRTEAFNVTLLEPENSYGESNFKAFRSEGEWSAFLDESSSQNTGFSIRPNGETNGYMENGVIHGNTGSEIHFAINFDNEVDPNESQCAVVKVLYHGNQCMHKILVRKGYNAPLKMGNGKRWSSFALYQATNTGRIESGRQVFNAVLTKNPLMLGSMFRRGKQDQGIFVWNNMQPDLATFVPPGNNKFVVGLKKTGAVVTPGEDEEQKWKNQWEEFDWATIDYSRDYRTDNLGTFYALDDNGEPTKDANGNTLKYQVPSYQDFQDLTDNSEFGFGVFYGSAAKEPQKEAKFAYGLIDPFNQGLFDDPNGMRAVVAYDKETGNQILFPVGRYGIGVRRMFLTPSTAYNGNLHYSDVYQPLSIARNRDNLYRPIPYNLPIVSGCIYWIDQFVAANTYQNQPNNCLGWDMNYFSFDFNAYTANNWQDACPIKFVIDE